MTIDYTDPRSLEGWDPSVDLGFPGDFPYTRGIQPTMYRGRLWTMRQYAGFGTAAESNQRYRYLLAQGVSGLSVAFDLPTQMGYDSDHLLATGEVGRVGVAIDSIEDMAELVDGIPLDRVSISMTINATAIILLALYVAVARRRGIPAAALSGTVQNDILKEYVARGTYIYPPRPSLRIVTDIFAYCERELPQWNTISISGYHIREAGSTAVEEVAFTFANAIAYVQAAIEAGLDVDRFGQRLSFFFNAHNDFLEEIAKFRAARRLWARIMRERFGATTSPRRAAALPYPDGRQHAHRPAARQQHRPCRGAGAGRGARRDAIAALQRPRRSAGAADRRGGADRAQDAADDRRRNRRAEHGRSARRRLRDRGADQRDRERRAWRSSSASRPRAERSRRSSRASSNAPSRNPRIAPSSRSTPASASSSASMHWRPTAATSIEVMRLDPEIERRQIERVRAVRASRDAAAWRTALDQVVAAARGSDNLVPPIVRAVEARATVGEIADAMRSVFGEHKEVDV